MSGGKSRGGKESAGTWEWQRGESLGTARSCKGEGVGETRHYSREGQRREEEEMGGIQMDPLRTKMGCLSVGCRYWVTVLYEGGTVSCKMYS